MRQTLTRPSMRCCTPASIDRPSIFCTVTKTSIVSIPQVRNTDFSLSFSARCSASPARRRSQSICATMSKMFVQADS